MRLHGEEDDAGGVDDQEKRVAALRHACVCRICCGFVATRARARVRRNPREQTTRGLKRSAHMGRWRKGAGKNAARAGVGEHRARKTVGGERSAQDQRGHREYTWRWRASVIRTSSRRRRCCTGRTNAPMERGASMIQLITSAKELHSDSAVNKRPSRLGRSTKCQFSFVTSCMYTAGRQSRSQPSGSHCDPSLCRNKSAPQTRLQANCYTSKEQKQVGTDILKIGPISFIQFSFVHVSFKASESQSAIYYFTLFGDFACLRAHRERS